MVGYENLIGKTVGEWKVVDKAKSRGKGVIYVCQCSCGNVAEVYGYKLRKGLSYSCGCKLKERELTTKKLPNYGPRSRLLKCWIDMLYRCYRPTCLTVLTVLSFSTPRKALIFKGFKKFLRHEHTPFAA